jgi:hypothetical protein
MHSRELEEIRSLFERAETESDPERKFSLLEEALDLTDDLSAPPDSAEQTIASNLRRSNLHRLLAQLTSMRNLEAKAWFNYIRLFLLRLEPEVQAILSSDPSLRESHRKFVDLWRDELVAALERSR